ncbi:hypothetical protein [Leptospira barantonii]|uniref:Uncharacterized protein n=1 Tax=Leptospira barantonii TaxID=2023184 RepID=A0ABX4NKU0_9LEPT|nr:hypothetical protein [Leptospira barantonii]PJZ57424.1 hypothetical protein CH367_08665 [Leptospira barantonii]
MKNSVKETILLLISLSIFLISLNNNPEIARLAFNADNLYPAILYQDLITDGNPLYGWSLTPSPFVVPDVAVYFLIHAIVQNSLLSVYVSYAFQALFLLFAVSFFLNADRKTKSEKEDTNRIILFVYSIFLILFSVSSYFFPVLGFAAHGGALSFSLLCFGTWKRLSILSAEVGENGNSNPSGVFAKSQFVNFTFLKLLSNPKKRNIFFLWFLFGTAQILLIVSDPLFLLFFNAPFFLFCLGKLRTNFNRSMIQGLVVSTFCALLGLYFYRTLTKSDFVFIPTGYYSGTPSWNWIQPILVTLRTQLASSPFSFLFIWISYPILTFMKFFFEKRMKGSNGTSSDSYDRFSFLILSVFVSTFGIVVIGSLSGISQKDGIHLRYLLPLLFFWIPILADILFGLMMNYKKGIFIFCNIFFFISLLFILFQGNLNPTFYRDVLAACLDRISEEPGNIRLGRGLADFWTSRRIRIFSETNLRADNYMPDLHPEYWENSWSWFTKTPEQEYNFAVLPGLDLNILKYEFGEPAFVSSCENHKILIWNETSQERFKNFRKKKIEEIELWHKLTGRRYSSPERR